MQFPQRILLTCRHSVTTCSTSGHGSSIMKRAYAVKISSGSAGLCHQPTHGEKRMRAITIRVSPYRSLRWTRILHWNRTTDIENGFDGRLLFIDITKIEQYAQNNNTDIRLMREPVLHRGIRHGPRGGWTGWSPEHRPHYGR